MEMALEVKNLNKAYPGFALKDLSFSLPCGSIMGLIGENGAGKTTTLKAILNLIHRDSGEITLLGHRDGGLDNAIKAQIGVVFDESCFHDNLTLRHISTVMGGIYPNWDPAYFTRLTRQLSLPEGKPVKALSKGMKTKLCIAAALAHRPRLLLLDEPTSGLDPIVREEILDLFMDFIQDERSAILLSSHITSDLDKIADYVTFIHEGQVALSDNKDELTGKMGILKCSEQALPTLDRSQALRLRKGKFSCEVLVRDKNAYRIHHPGAVVEPATLEDIMLFYVRGRTL